MKYVLDASLGSAPIAVFDDDAAPATGDSAVANDVFGT